MRCAFAGGPAAGQCKHADPPAGRHALRRQHRLFRLPPHGAAERYPHPGQKGAGAGQRRRFCDGVRRIAGAGRSQRHRDLPQRPGQLSESGPSPERTATGEHHAGGNVSCLPRITGGAAGVSGLRGRFGHRLQPRPHRSYAAGGGAWHSMLQRPAHAGGAGQTQPGAFYRPAYSGKRDRPGRGAAAAAAGKHHPHRHARLWQEHSGHSAG